MKNILKIKDMHVYDVIDNKIIMIQVLKNIIMCVREWERTFDIIKEVQLRIIKTI